MVSSSLHSLIRFIVTLSYTNLIGWILTSLLLLPCSMSWLLIAALTNPHSTESFERHGDASSAQSKYYQVLSFISAVPNYFFSNYFTEELSVSYTVRSVLRCMARYAASANCRKTEKFCRAPTRSRLWLRQLLSTPRSITPVEILDKWRSTARRTDTVMGASLINPNCGRYAIFPWGTEVQWSLATIMQPVKLLKFKTVKLNF